jgi:CTP synthase
VNIRWIDSKSKILLQDLAGVAGMVIPGGLKGKTALCNFAQEHDIPLLALGVSDPAQPERCGAFPVTLVPGSKMHALYGCDEISERYRGADENELQTLELPNQSFFVAVQFHPEFKSRPNKPPPLFVGLVQAALGGNI